MDTEKKFIWLSFVDREEEVSLGCCIVEGSEFMNAVNRAHALRINPGGEVMGVLLTQAERDKCPIEINKLYSPEELEELNFITNVNKKK